MISILLAVVLRAGLLPAVQDSRVPAQENAVRYEIRSNEARSSVDSGSVANSCRVTFSRVSIDANPLIVKPTVETQVKIKPTVEPEIKTKPTVETQIKTKPTVEPEIKTKPTVETQAKTKPTVEPEIKTKPGVETPKTKPTVEPEIKTKPGVETQPKTKPTVEPEIKAKPSVDTQVKTRPTVEPETKLIALQAGDERWLRVKKTATVVSGVQIEWRIELTATGGSLYDVDVEDVLSSGLVWVPAAAQDLRMSLSWDRSGQTVLAWRIQRLLPGETATITILTRPRAFTHSGESDRKRRRFPLRSSRFLPPPAPPSSFSFQSWFSSNASTRHSRHTL